MAAECCGLDDGMEKWGGENIEFALRTWLCGGSVEVIRDSTTAHWFKTGFRQRIRYRRYFPLA